MTFRDFFNKYKVIAFIMYALIIAVVLTFVKIWWINLILILPLIALGTVILIGFFPHRKEGYLTVVCLDGLGSVQMTSFAIVKAVRDATNAVNGVKYRSCAVLSDKTGLSVCINIKIAHMKVIEISEVLRVYVKKLLEKEMNIRVNKIDLVIENVVYDCKVDKLVPGEPGTPQVVLPEPEIYDENAPSYKFKYGEKESTFRVPSNNMLRTREITGQVRRVKTKELFTAVTADTPEKSLPEPQVPVAGPVEQAAEQRSLIHAAEPPATEPETQNTAAENTAAVSIQQSADMQPAPRPAAETLAEAERAQPAPIKSGQQGDVQEFPPPEPESSLEQVQRKRGDAARMYYEFKAKQEQRRLELEEKEKN